MAEITVTVDGKVLSHVYSGQKVSEVSDYLAAYRSVYVVYDNNVACYAHMVESALSKTGNLKGSMGIEATEEKKDIQTVLDICQWMLSLGANRDALVLAIGGGITTDMAGFAASVYKRGVKFAFVPTTLLSQVDAAIGGKTGVNYSSLKNMLGVIRQPEFTFECPEVLESLPYRDFVSGTAELLKTFLIDDTGSCYEKAVEVLSAINAASDKSASIKENRSDLLDLIRSAAAVKAGVVSRDQFEQGERRKLNLGHTFAHALETQSRKVSADMTHGEAVAIGMIMASHLSEAVGAAPSGFTHRLYEDFKRCGLPTDNPYELDALSAAMLKDKKAEGNKIHFVLVGGVGNVFTRDMTVAEAMDSIK